MNVRRFSLKQLLWFTGVVWAMIGSLTLIVPNDVMFHFLNPISIALGTVIVLVYSGGLIDILQRDGEAGASPAHLLILGLTLNWVGMIIRMARWFVTGEHPAVASDIDYWFYNFGLWISIWAGMFLLGAADIAVKPIKTSTMFVIFLIIFSFLLYLGGPIDQTAFTP